MRGEEGVGEAAPAPLLSSADPSSKAAALRFLVPDSGPGLSFLVCCGLAVLLGVEDSRVLRRGVACVAGDAVSGLNRKFSISSLPLNDEGGGVSPLILVDPFSSTEPILSARGLICLVRCGPESSA